MKDFASNEPHERLKSVNYAVISSDEDSLTVEIRRIGLLVDAWLKPQISPIPNHGAARRMERKLHAAIKDGPLYGIILNFAGLNIWVDDQTPEGTVKSQEVINL